MRIYGAHIAPAQQLQGWSGASAVSAPPAAASVAVAAAAAALDPARSAASPHWAHATTLRPLPSPTEGRPLV